ncbi:efflux RND transporter periplasmic adaptor subunit [Helicobacter anatolicus]|uniref:efflux RND transporter periplasmic adaptor subunit n=1 Tax=Helicobacter anatolicus TaxID=2905874 RepID=UPI001E51C46F|nr:efflux RND transporter periplasmic adaptor subunit [Helicobacter anatolicus]MCE3038058.1 efflux RND transporter periplasmic adaptor subunit [Helicobacter anatolicus]
MKKFLVVLGMLCGIYAYDEVKISANEIKKLGIRTIVVGEGVKTKGIPFNAYVDFDSKTSITQSSTIDAIVVALHKRGGEKVQKGDVICEISSNELNNLFFELENAQNRYRIAQEIEAKDKKLFKSGVISQREYQVSYLNANELRLKVMQLQTTFNTFGIDSKNPKGEFGFRIIAKESGVLAIAPKQTGEKIFAFTPYIRITDGVDLLAYLRVPINMANYVKTGAKVFNKLGEYVGEIKTISVVIDHTTNTVVATALLNQTRYKVGETIELYVDGSFSKNSLVIPSDTVIKSENDYLVFKKTKSGFLPIKVKILEEKNKAFIVDSFNQIKAGDVIATGAIITLKGIMNNIGD